MRFMAADPDIATIFNRIQDKEIDLQPDFQRGEVWPVSKKQRLIDTILRGWVVPPVLVIDDEAGGALQVLDGQQRLAAIREFKQGAFRIDGSVEPISDFIAVLNGLSYFELPTDVARKFDRTTLRFYHVLDYEPDEPAEIFFRLNQPTTLTSAEKRNAFFGPIRRQIRELAEALEINSAARLVLGFSNSRMAYDDVIARLATILEGGTLLRKVTAAGIDSMYRRKVGLPSFVNQRLELAVNRFIETANLLQLAHSPPKGIKLNKAAALSWLILLVRLPATEVAAIADFFEEFEICREAVLPLPPDDHVRENRLLLHDRHLRPLLNTFNDRSTSRVGDVSSVVLRDFVLAYAWDTYTLACGLPQYDTREGDLKHFRQHLRNLAPTAVEAFAQEFAEDVRWGKEI